jgi:(p)ppGpp synthase/HD superfamily hydrolase
MFTRSAEPTEVPATGARWRRTRSKRAAKHDRATADQESPLTRKALAFASRCHAGERRESDDAPFIEHPLEVARLLRTAGCSDVVIAAGLLHDVVARADVSAGELTRCFGTDVAGLVIAVTDDESVYSYRRRKRVLRDQVRNSGPDAAALFAADRISRLREMPAQITRDRARFDETAAPSRVREHLEDFQQMRLEHHEESLRMLRSAAPRHLLVTWLADELAHCRATIGSDAPPGRR